MDKARSSKMLASLYQTTRCNITQDSNLNSVVFVSSFPLHGALHNSLVIIWRKNDGILFLFSRSLKRNRRPVDANKADNEALENLIFTATQT